MLPVMLAVDLNQAAGNYGHLIDEELLHLAEVGFTLQMSCINYEMVCCRPGHDLKE